MSWVKFKLRTDKFCNLGDLRPFVLVGNIFGLAQYKFANNRLEPGYKINRCYVFVLFGVRLYFRYVAVTTSFRPELHALRAITGTMISTLVALEIADFVVTAFFDKCFITFFDKLAIYDERVAKLGHPRRDRVWTYWIFLILTSLYTIFLFGMKYGNIMGSVWMNIPPEDLRIIIQNVTYILGILKFNLLVHLMFQRFRHLNKTILPSVSWTRELTPKNLNSVTAGEVVFLHATLVDASRIINRIYNPILLAWFTNLFFTIASNFHAIGVLEWYWILPQVIPLFAEILLICKVCNSTAEEANNTGKYTSKVEPTLIEDSTAMNRVRMQLYLYNNRVVFKAGDFFVINLPLIYPIFISVATYTLLLKNYAKVNGGRS